MASKPKAKAAPAPAEEPEVVAEVAIPQKSYKLSLPDSLAMLREVDILHLSDDDRRAAILEIKALLGALEEAEKLHDDHLEHRIWLLQTWDNVTRLRIDDVRQERVLPDYSIKVTRLFDEDKLALAAAEEAARIEAEKAAMEAERAAAEAKAKAEAKAEADAAAELHAAEHGEDTPTNEAPHTSPTVAAEAETSPHEEPNTEDTIEEGAAVAQTVEDEAVSADHDDEIIAEGEYEGSEPSLSLEAGEDGFVKLRLLEDTEISNIRIPAHTNIETTLEHAEELVGKDSARPLRPNEEFEPKE
jgi:hypothetical protein